MDKNLLKYLSTAPVLITAWMSFTAGFIIELQRYAPDTLSLASY
jgi:photosystem I subunit 9